MARRQAGLFCLGCPLQKLIRSLEFINLKMKRQNFDSGCWTQASHMANDSFLIVQMNTYCYIFPHIKEQLNLRNKSMTSFDSYCMIKRSFISAREDTKKIHQ